MNRRVLSTRLVAIVVAIIVLAGIVPGSQAAAPPEDAPASWQGHPSCAGVTAETPSTPACDALIAARPQPMVTPLPTDFGVLADVEFIRFPSGAVTLYDEPEGEAVDTLTVGYTWVAVRRYNDDSSWAEIRPGRWVQIGEDTSRSRPTSFAGVQIQGMDMPFAFVLWRHCATTGPNGPRECEGDFFLERYQLVNIYATVNIAGWDWHLIGPGRWTNQQNLSIVYPAAPAVFPGKWVAVNTYEQNLVAYEGATPRMATLVSTGIANGEWNTWPGTYSVRLKIENGPMDGEQGEEDYYSLDQVPYHMYFNGLIALHGAYWHNSFGYPHSHGCVNLSISDAKWLYDHWVVEGTTVHVYDSSVEE